MITGSTGTEREADEQPKHTNDVDIRPLQTVGGRGMGHKYI